MRLMRINVFNCFTSLLSAMETGAILELPGSAVAEYLLVLQPHEDLFNRIMQEKQAFARAYDCPAASFGQPQIVLAKIVQRIWSEPNWLRRIARTVSEHKPFTVTLENYGSFPTHSIYLQVKTKTAIVSLVKALRQHGKYLYYDAAYKPHFITEPHLTIARKLLPWQYEQAWQAYRHQFFSGMFLAKEVLLLRRRLSEKHYHILERFALEGKQQQVVQGGLFEIF